MCKQIADGKLIHRNGKNEVKKSHITLLQTGEIINSSTYASLGNKNRMWQILKNLESKSDGILIIGDEVYFIGKPTSIMNENKLQQLLKQYKTTEDSFTYSNWKPNS